MFATRLRLEPWPRHFRPLTGVWPVIAPRAGATRLPSLARAVGSGASPAWARAQSSGPQKTPGPISAHDRNQNSQNPLHGEKHSDTPQKSQSEPLKSDSQNTQLKSSQPQSSHSQHGHSHTQSSHTHSMSESHSHSHDSDHSHEHSLFGHSHSHQSNELLGKGFLTDPAVRITWIGLVVNVIMAGGKGVGGVFFHSQALIADAIHSVSDMVADFLTLATVNVASKTGSSTNYPLGYGKIESVGTFCVAGALLFAGFSVGWTSLLQIFEFILPSSVMESLQALPIHSHSHSFGADPSHGHSHASIEESSSTPPLPNINAAWLALGSIVVKEILYRKTMKVAEQTQSKVLVANAWHHRVDSLTAGVAFATVTGGVLLGYSWLDAVGGLLVSVLIVHAGLGSFKEAWFELIDRGYSPKDEQFTKYKSIVNQEVENVSTSVASGFNVVDFSVLGAGARSTLIVKLGFDKDVALSTITDLEHELAAGIKGQDKNVGKIIFEYEFAKEAKKEQ